MFDGGGVDDCGVSSGIGGGGGGGGAVGGGASGANGESEAYDIGHSGGGSEADLIDKEVKFKRSLGIAFLAAGLLAIGYVVAKARNTKKEADLQGPQGPEV